MYRDVHRLMSMLPLKDYVPYTWITMVDVKSHYFHALAHLYVSLAVWDQHDSDDVEMLAEHFPVLHIHESSKASPRATVASEIPQNRDERKAFGERLKGVIVESDFVSNALFPCLQLKLI